MLRVFYEYAVVVPANTAESSPVEEDLHLAHGIIHRVDVQFPIGCAGLARCRLSHHSFGHMPDNPQGYFASDGFIIGYDTNLEFFSEPYIARATCWNMDDTYQHTITIRFGMIESKFALAVISVVKGLLKFLKLVGIKE